jgi:hypothetical protein
VYVAKIFSVHNRNILITLKHKGNDYLTSRVIQLLFRFTTIDLNIIACALELIMKYNNAKSEEQKDKRRF